MKKSQVNVFFFFFKMSTRAFVHDELMYISEDTQVTT